MSRIEINAGGRHIIVEHGGELEPMKQAALDLWGAAEKVPDRLGPATGFQIVEHGHTTVSPMGNSAYDRGYPPAPVTASADLPEGEARA